MAKIVSFEGGIGAGKTTLANYLSNHFGLGKILEHDYQNPFINEFYDGANVHLETELSFLLQHYSLMKKARATDGVVLADFSIGKDLVFARLNLKGAELSIFEKVYEFLVNEVGDSELIVYLDLPFDELMHRVQQRGRISEVNFDPEYFRSYSDHLCAYCKSLPEKSIVFLNEDYHTSNEELLIQLGKDILSKV